MGIFQFPSVLPDPRPSPASPGCHQKYLLPHWNFIGFFPLTVSSHSVYTPDSSSFSKHAMSSQSSLARLFPVPECHALSFFFFT